MTDDRKGMVAFFDAYPAEDFPIRVKINGTLTEISQGLWQRVWSEVKAYKRSVSGTVVDHAAEIDAYTDPYDALRRVFSYGYAADMLAKDQRAAHARAEHAARRLASMTAARERHEANARARRRAARERIASTVVKLYDAVDAAFIEGEPSPEEMAELVTMASGLAGSLRAMKIKVDQRAYKNVD